LESFGNASAPVTLLVNPASDLCEPSFSDGVRTLRFGGVILAGRSLLMDGVAGKVTLDGMDVTAWTTGDFPRVSPGTTQLTCSAPQLNAYATVSWRDRWW
jgi:hypothetical protein